MTSRRRAKWLGGLFVAVVAAALLAASCGGGGEKVVYVGEPTGSIAFVSERDGNREIYVMKADGSGATRLTNDVALDDEPWWSPDGTRLAFSSARGASIDLYTMNPDGSDARQLTEHPSVDGGPRWSPDGSRIAFYTLREGETGLLWVMNADGSEPRPLLQLGEPEPETACSAGFPGGWSADGQRVFFRGSQGSIRALQICSVGLDNPTPEVVLSETNVASEFPSLSPDGTRIAFTTNRDGNREIYTMKADGGGLRRVTQHSGLDQYPVWSPDGQWIAFHSDRDGDLEIYVMRPDGSDVRQLTANGAADMNPTWSPK